MARKAAKKKSAAKRSSKPAPKPVAKKPARNAAASPSKPRKVAAPSGEDVVYSDVRREMRSRLLGRLLGT